MPERRSFLTAVGTALLGVGLAGIFAYYIAQSALPLGKRGAYPVIPVACGGTILFGVLAIIWFWVSHVTHRRRIRALGGFIVRGIAIHRKVPYGIKLTDKDTEELWKEVDSWSRMVGDWLESSFPEYVAHFVNPAGSPLVEGLLGTQPPEQLRTFIDVRLGRLSEILIKL